MNLIVLILAGIALTPTLACAQEEFEFRVGGDIFNGCSAPIRSTACLAYIEGIADALASGASIHGWRACFKERVSARSATINDRALPGRPQGGLE
jgi:hypothetical protein